MEEFKEILVPVDGSELSKKALNKALSLAENFGAKVSIIHVYGRLDETVFGLPPGADWALPTDLKDDFILKNEEGLFKEYRKMAKRQGKKVSTISECGNPADQIIKASKRFDLIIMGIHGRSNLAHLLIGSVAEKVTRHAYYPILLIREKSKD